MLAQCWLRSRRGLASALSSDWGRRALVAGLYCPGNVRELRPVMGGHLLLLDHYWSDTLERLACQGCRSLRSPLASADRDCRTKRPISQSSASRRHVVGPRPSGMTVMRSYRIRKSIALPFPAAVVTLAGDTPRVGRWCVRISTPPPPQGREDWREFRRIHQACLGRRAFRSTLERPAPAELDRTLAVLAPN